MRHLLCLCCLALLSGCASIISGTSQDIAVGTDPAGARCVFERQGQTVGVVDPTPGKVTVQKSKFDIDVKCTKDGYAVAAKHLDSDIEGGTFGNIIAGGLIGWAIDSSTGADNKYDAAVFLTMQQTAPAAPPVAAPATPSVPAAPAVATVAPASASDDGCGDWGCQK